MQTDSSPRALDPLDLQLLALLEMDGRMSHARLARRVGRSRSAIQERIERLERLGHITGYTIRRGHRGAEVQAYLLVSASAASHDHVAAALQAFPEVRVCDSVSGELDLILQVQARDIAGVDRVRAAVAALPGVARTRTALVMQTRFHRGERS
jgi:Lrp/AsnC family transcriptional regulator, leucine-responsive regulatory protein